MEKADAQWRDLCTEVENGLDRMLRGQVATGCLEVFEHLYQTRRRHIPDKGTVEVKLKFKIIIYVVFSIFA